MFRCVARITSKVVPARDFPVNDAAADAAIAVIPAAVGRGALDPLYFL